MFTLASFCQAYFHHVHNILWLKKNNIYSDTESFKLLQMIVQRLDICKDTHRVRLVPHIQHVFHLDQTQTVSLLPET